MNENQRKRTRVNFTTLVTLKTNERLLDGLASRNLSLKGIYVMTDERLKENEEVHITISLSGASSEVELRMEGSVIRIDAGGMAIDFKEIDLDSFFHLRNIVLHNSTDPSSVDDELASIPAFK